MKFSTRNAFYLRASNYRVVPLFLYLDERHVDWMSDRVLQLVIADLKDKVKELLTVERYDKKHKVHVERGDTYQYCYFLRKTTRTEVVLLKNKTYALRGPTPQPAPEPEPDAEPRMTRKRKRASVSYNEEGEEDFSIEEEEVLVKDEPVSPPRLSPPGEPADDTAPPTALEAEAEEDPDEQAERQIKHMKPDVSLRYQGFGTSSVQLVLIIEPYPPLPPSQYAPPASRLSTRSASLARSRSRTGTLRASRYTSATPSVPQRGPTPSMRNMRNASRSVSVAQTPGPSASGRGWSATPGPGGGERGRSGATPLFYPADTPFDMDEEDEDAHEEYTQALREGRLRLPSVAPREDDEEDENPDDVPEGIEKMGERMMQSSIIEEGVVRNYGGWEERAMGEDSDVLGNQDPN